jgi:hypothetical protein
MKLTNGTAQFGLKYGICNRVGIVNYKEVKKIIEFCKLKKSNLLLLLSDMENHIKY